MKNKIKNRKEFDEITKQLPDRILENLQNITIKDRITPTDLCYYITEQYKFKFTSFEIDIITLHIINIINKWKVSNFICKIYPPQTSADEKSVVYLVNNKRLYKTQHKQVVSTTTTTNKYPNLKYCEHKELVRKLIKRTNTLVIHILTNSRGSMSVDDVVNHLTSNGVFGEWDILYIRKRVSTACSHLYKTDRIQRRKMRNSKRHLYSFVNIPKELTVKPILNDYLEDEDVIKEEIKEGGDDKLEFINTRIKALEQELEHLKMVKINYVKSIEDIEDMVSKQ